MALCPAPSVTPVYPPLTRPQIIKCYRLHRRGYTVEPHRVHTEPISGTKLKARDVVVVAKLDRLGLNASDIDRTVEHLRMAGIRVVVLDLPAIEVTSAAGDLVRRMFAAFAQFERHQLVERTHVGLARAKAKGKTLRRQDALAVLAEKRGIQRGTLHQDIREKLSNVPQREAWRALRGIPSNHLEGGTGFLIVAGHISAL